MIQIWNRSGLHWLSRSMRIIEIRPSRKFIGAWAAVEGSGVEPAFATGTPKADAISYALSRFGGSTGAIQVYDETGEKVVESITMDDRIKYPHAQ